MGDTFKLLYGEQDGGRVHLYLGPGVVACDLPEGEQVLCHGWVEFVTCKRCLAHAKTMARKLPVRQAS